MAMTWLANQCTPSLPTSLYVAGSANLLPLHSFSFSPFLAHSPSLSLSLRRRRGMEVVKGLVGSVGYWSGVSSETERLRENSVWSEELKVPPQALVLTLSPLSFLFSHPSFPFSDAFLYRPVFCSFFSDCTFSLFHSSLALDRNHYRLLSAFSTLCVSVFQCLCLVHHLSVCLCPLLHISWHDIERTEGSWKRTFWIKHGNVLQMAFSWWLLSSNTHPLTPYLTFFTSSDVSLTDRLSELTADLSLLMVFSPQVCNSNWTASWNMMQECKKLWICVIWYL